MTEEAQLFKIERVSFLFSPTAHSKESREETGKGGRKSATPKGHLFGGDIPKSVSTSLRPSGCQLMHFDREESLPRFNESLYGGMFWEQYREESQYRTSTLWSLGLTLHLTPPNIGLFPPYPRTREKSVQRLNFN